MGKPLNLYRKPGTKTKPKRVRLIATAKDKEKAKIERLPRFKNYLVFVTSIVKKEHWVQCRELPYKFPETVASFHGDVFKIIAPDAATAEEWAISKMMDRHFKQNIKMFERHVVEINDDLDKEFKQMQLKEWRSQGHDV